MNFESAERRSVRGKGEATDSLQSSLRTGRAGQATTSGELDWPAAYQRANRESREFPDNNDDTVKFHDEPC